MPPLENSSCTRSSKRRIVAMSRYAFSNSSRFSCTSSSLRSRPGPPILHARRLFHNPQPSAASVQDLAQGDRSEPPDVDSNVELPRQRLQPAMAVAMQIEPALAHAAPAAKRVVAQHQGYALRGDLDIRLHALPTVELRRCRRIVVARDEVLAAIEPSEQLGDHRRALANGEVAEMPYHVVRPDRLAPPRDQRLVHRRDRGERPTIEPERAAVAEMRIAGEEDRHVIPEA